jgi:alpha-glucosidase (family GH31 glycosyl hydrolase)
MDAIRLESTFFIKKQTSMCSFHLTILGAFNPFFRNHNGEGYKDQDPAVFSAPVVASNRRAVELRYTLIPHLYTLFYLAHISGGTVVRSMAHVFPTISECWPLDEQFLWGSSLLIAPVIYENHMTKSVYLPMAERWFDYYTGEEQKTLGNITVPAPLDFIPLYLRGGTIIPHQQSAMNTVASRKKPLYLVVALDGKQSASGELFWDDGESIDTYERSVFNFFKFSYNSNRLTLEPWTYKYPQMGDEIKLEEITIFGIDKQPMRVVWNGQDLTPTSQWTFDATKQTLNMKTLALNMAKTHKFVFL